MGKDRYLNLFPSEEQLMSLFTYRFFSDAATMGSMIRSESTRFGDYMDKFKKPKMPKSTSLPVIQVPISDITESRYLSTYIMKKEC